MSASSDELRRAAERERHIAAMRRRGADVITGLRPALACPSRDILVRSRGAWSGVAAAGFESMIDSEAHRLATVRFDLRTVVRRLLDEAERRIDVARSLEAQAESLEMAVVSGTPL